MSKAWDMYKEEEDAQDNHFFFLIMLGISTVITLEYWILIAITQFRKPHQSWLLEIIKAWRNLSKRKEEYVEWT